MNRKARILIVDDDKNLRKTLVDILGAKGFVPMGFAKGKTALKRVKESAPDVALIDLKLEDMSGLELMKEIKALSPSTECIVITGNASQASAIEAVNLGAFSFMLKPYNIEQLFVTIRRAVEKQEALETLKAQYKGIPVPTYTWQWDGEDLVLVDYNNAAEEITHGKIAGFLGIAAREMHQDTPEILEELVQCLNKKTSTQQEMLYQYKSTGESKHLAVKYAFVPPNLVLVHTEDITDRKKADEALQESEVKYRSVVEDSPVLIDRFLPDGTIIFVNQEYCRFFGKKYDELIGTNIQFQIPEKDREKVMSSIASFTKESPVQISENKVIRHDGEIRWVRWTDRALFDEKDHVTSYQSFGEDITGRVQAEQALSQSEEQYHSVVEDSPGVIGRFTPDGTITFANHEYCRFFGKKYDELIGMNIQSVIPEEGRESVMSYIASLTEESPIQTFENKVIRYDGEIRWMRWADRALFDDAGQIISIQSFGQDITAIVEAEQALRLEQEKAQKYLDIAAVIMIALNKKGEITLINQKGNNVLGYQEDELIGVNWFDTCLPEKIRKEVRGVFKKNMSGGDELVENYENPVLTKSGKERIIAWNNTVVWDEKGHNIGTLSSGEDITERKRAEKLLDALNKASVAMGSALTHKEIFNAVAKELKQLDISCMLFPLDETRSKLVTEYMSYESAILNSIEKLAGFTQKDFSFPVDAVDVYREVIREKKTLLSKNSEQIIKQVMPKFTKKFSAKIVKTLNVQRCIFTPLIIEDQVIGVFSVQSDNLTHEDIPVATAFSHQLADAWNKTKLVQNLRETVEGIIHAIAATVEARDPYTAGHQKRVADLAASIAREMRLSEHQIEGIRMAGTIHDLGKVQVPAEILSKPGKISDLEYGIIKTHPQVGFDLLKGIEFPWPITKMVLQHHEKMDGSGYPHGLKGNEILLDARILAVADVVEAISSHRPYRPALGIEKALDQIVQDKGILLDPDVVDACLKVFEQGYKLPEG